MEGTLLEVRSMSLSSVVLIHVFERGERRQREGICCFFTVEDQKK